jgi:hypothetical protein
MISIAFSLCKNIMTRASLHIKAPFGAHDYQRNFRGLLSYGLFSLEGVWNEGNRCTDSFGKGQLLRFSRELKHLHGAHFSAEARGNKGIQD